MEISLPGLQHKLLYRLRVLWLVYECTWVIGIIISSLCSNKDKSCVELIRNVLNKYERVALWLVQLLPSKQANVQSSSSLPRLPRPTTLIMFLIHCDWRLCVSRAHLCSGQRLFSIQSPSTTRWHKCLLLCLHSPEHWQRDLFLQLIAGLVRKGFVHRSKLAGECILCGFMKTKTLK